jgi:hypothetical protein
MNGSGMENKYITLKAIYAELKNLERVLQKKGIINKTEFSSEKDLILDWPEEIREFYPVLKSDSKREAQEAIWFNMCIDMDWPRIQTLQKYVDEAKFSF